MNRIPGPYRAHSGVDEKRVSAGLINSEQMRPSLGLGWGYRNAKLLKRMRFHHRIFRRNAEIGKFVSRVLERAASVCGSRSGRLGWQVQGELRI